MSEANTETAKAKGSKGKPLPANVGRKSLRAAGRKKKLAKLKTDKEFAKAFFESKSKRSNDKKAAFRKKKKNKK